MEMSEPKSLEELLHGLDLPRRRDSGGQAMTPTPDGRKVYVRFVIRGSNLEGLRFESYEQAQQVIEESGEIDHAYHIEKVYEVRYAG